MSLTNEAQIRSLRESVEGWEELILRIYNILLWEKQWHPLAIIGVTSSIFIFIWLSEMSTLTVLCLTGLILTLCDYMVPAISATFFKSEQWSSEKENIITSICEDFILYKTKLRIACGSYYRMRITNPKMYFTMTILTLILLAWIGNTLNNLFMIYLLVTIFCLMPGIEYTGFNCKLKEITKKYINDIFGYKTKQS